MSVVIRNPGVADLLAFLTLGVSSARGNEELIGQFGSGAKHALITLLREGIVFRIFLGLDELFVHTRDSFMGKTPFKAVYFVFKGKVYETSLTLGFGELDWTDPKMAYREIISNALDQNKNEWFPDLLETTNNPQPREGYTTVIIEGEGILEYTRNISKYFLHATGAQHKSKLDRLATDRTMRLYRKGVLIRELEDRQSLYHFNFDANTEDSVHVSIDEARNMDEGNLVSAYLSAVLSDQDMITNVLLNVDHRDFLEVDRTRTHHHGKAKGSYREIEDRIKTAWGIAYGDRPCCNDTLSKYATLLNPVCLPYGWYDICRQAGVASVEDVMTSAETMGLVTYEPSEEVMTNFSLVWMMLASIGMTEKRPTPPVLRIVDILNSPTEHTRFKGLCDREYGIIYLNEAYTLDNHVILHELAHYVTKANEYDDSFNEFLCETATRLFRTNANA